jgi:hypothetical protein
MRIIRGDLHGTGDIKGATYFMSNLKVQVLDANGNPKKVRHYFGSSRFQKAIYSLIYRNKTILDLGSGLVTHAGVRLMSQDTAVTAGTATLALAKNHGSGTGVTAATATDTALQTAIGTTATAGSNVNADASPNATVTSTATISYAATLAVTEWGLFTSTTLSGATMWDHKVFSAVNVTSGDSIAFTYTLTINSGG